jgi:hypothetical protein
MGFWNLDLLLLCLVLRLLSLMTYYTIVVIVAIDRRYKRRCVLDLGVIIGACSLNHSGHVQKFGLVHSQQVVLQNAVLLKEVGVVVTFVFICLYCTLSWFLVAVLIWFVRGCRKNNTNVPACRQVPFQKLQTKSITRTLLSMGWTSVHTFI